VTWLLREDMLRLPFETRFNYDDDHNILFLNLSELKVNSQDIIEQYRDKVRSIVEPRGHKV
jgi:propionate CoA-transferase